MLANTPMLAPAYFIVGGSKSGEVRLKTRFVIYLAQLHCQFYVRHASKDVCASILGKERCECN